MKIVEGKSGSICLGRQGENLVTKVVLPLASLKICGGSPVLIHQRATDTQPYPVAVTEADDTVEWDVTSADTAIPGCGRAELRWIGTNGEVAKSRVYSTHVIRGMAEPTDPPDPYTGYLTKIAEDVQAAENAATRAEQAAEEAEFSAEEALLALTESGLITPAGNGKGGVYTNNGKILVI